MLTKAPLRILTYTSLYPNSQMPEHGIFTARRMASLTRVLDHPVEVVAPVPYFPSFLPAPKKWRQWSRVPQSERLNGICVHHPRYFNPPRVGMARYGGWMAGGSKFLVTRLLKRDFPFDVIDAHFAYPDGYAALLLGQLLNRPVVVSGLGSDVIRNSKYPHIVPCLKFLARHAAQMIAVSEELKRYLIDLGAPAGKVHVSPVPYECA